MFNIVQYFDRYLKTTKKLLNPKDHEIVTLLTRQLQDDIVNQITLLKNNNGEQDFIDELSVFLLNNVSK